MAVILHSQETIDRYTAAGFWGDRGGLSHCHRRYPGGCDRPRSLQLCSGQSSLENAESLPCTFLSEVAREYVAREYAARGYVGGMSPSPMSNPDTAPGAWTSGTCPWRSWESRRRTPWLPAPTSWRTSPPASPSTPPPAPRNRPPRPPRPTAALATWGGAHRSRPPRQRHRVR